jgi:restriction endonuclease S subunit
LSDQYGEEKQKVIEDYPIFMAIAEDIGYDATGKSTNNNELDFIGRELARFIESIESGKDGFFLGLDVDKDKIFLILYSALEARLDSNFYKTEYTSLISKIKKLPNNKLGHFVEFSDETWDQKTIFNKIFPYIEIGEIDISSGEIKNISNIEIQDAPSRAKMIVRGGDILISTTRPNRGAIVKIDEVEHLFIASTGFSIIRKITKNNINNKFLFHILRQSLSLKQMEQRSSGGNYPAITQEELKNILIPNPLLEIQDKIVAKMDDAYAAKKQKELEAQRLLDSIDDYLLGELGIELPEPEENTIKNRIFIRNLREVSGDRFDSYYYKNIFELLKQSVLNGKYPINRLRDLSSDIQNGVEIRNYSNRGFRYLRVTDLGKYDINNNSPRYVDVTEIPSRIILNERCLLVSRSGSLGLISRVEPEIQNAILSSHIFKVELDINIIVPEYAEAFLRSKVGQLEIFRENNGGVIPEINQIALGKILIPFPPLEKQIEISEHITAIRNQAKQLQQQAKDDLEKAKQEVEAMILGDD